MDSALYGLGDDREHPSKGIIVVLTCYHKYVSKYAYVTIGIAAVLLTGIIPNGDACALGATSDHACCYKPEAEATSSCCSSNDTAPPHASADDALDCRCAHQPATPATTTTTISPSGAEENLQSARTASNVVLDGSAGTRAESVERRVRSHPPPPAYLLNCANLN